MSWEQLRRAVVMVVVGVSAVVALAFAPGVHAHADSASGAVRWTVALRGGAWGVTADRGGAVVVGDDGSVTAITPGGRERWTIHDLDVTEANPALSGTVVLVGGETGVTALDRTDGHVLWHADEPGPALALALADDLALVGGDPGVLTAYDARSGAVRWSVTRPGELWSAPRVDGGTGAVVATWHGGDQPRVEVLHLATGGSRWSAPVASGTAAPVVAGRGPEALVVLASGDGHYTSAVEARSLLDGEPRWRAAVPASFERAIEPAAGAHDVVVVDHFGTVTSLSLRDGATRWQRALDEPVLATRISLTRSRVVLTTYEGTLVVLGRADGRRISATGRRDLGGYPLGGQAVRWRGRPGWITGLRLGPATLALVRIA